MGELRFAVIGIGATGSVLAAALLGRYPETILVDSRPGLKEALLKDGIRISGSLSYETPVKNIVESIEELEGYNPNIIFISTKTFHLDSVLKSLKEIAGPETRFISTHNGLGPEDLIAEYFSPEATFRMSLNYGVSLVGPGEVEMAFFNKPNHLGALSKKSKDLGLKVADILTGEGLDTEFVDDIKLYVWKKMINKCTMASICAVTDRTIKAALTFPPTREIADACFNEALEVAKAMGYDLGEGYLKQAMAYLENVGEHKDSMCYDIEQKSRTEIDFLGGKVVEYARLKGIDVPYYTTMTNLVRSLEDSYL